MNASEPYRLETLIADIKKRVKGKAAIVGIGNIIRADDGLGPKLIEMLRKEKINAALFDCGTAPENYAFPILSTGAETIIFVDAADLASQPGEIRIFGYEQIANVSFSTHSPSPRLFIDLLMTGKDDLNVFFISIQPKTTLLGEGISDGVFKSIALLKDALLGALA